MESRIKLEIATPKTREGKSFMIEADDVGYSEEGPIEQHIWEIW